MTKKTSRSFSKKMAVGNVLAAWAAVAVSVYKDGDPQVVSAALSLIGFIVAGYMGVGHLDYRSVLNANTNKKEQSDDFAPH